MAENRASQKGGRVLVPTGPGRRATAGSGGRWSGSGEARGCASDSLRKGNPAKLSRALSGSLRGPL